MGDMQTTASQQRLRHAPSTASGVVSTCLERPHAWSQRCKSVTRVPRALLMTQSLPTTIARCTASPAGATKDVWIALHQTGQMCVLVWVATFLLELRAELSFQGG